MQERLERSTQADGDDVSQSDQQSFNMSLMFGRSSESSQHSILDMQQISGETIEMDEILQQSEIIAQEIM